MTVSMREAFMAARSPEDVAHSLAAVDAKLMRFAVAIRAAREQADVVRVAALVGEADTWLDRRVELLEAFAPTEDLTQEGHR